MADHGNGNDEARLSGISVSSEFDFSFENHFRAMHKISKLSGQPEFEHDQSEIQRLSSSITFLREWRHFCYQPRALRFASQSETPQGRDVLGGLYLPQFSAAAVPKKDRPDANEVSSQLSKDFVMHVGGLVWALDWCPRVPQSPDPGITVEFIAVSAHPPDSSYHKVGAPLTGRGVVQIWCLVNAGVKDEDVIPWVKGKKRKYSRSDETKKLKETQPKRPRGRPRKNPISDPVHKLDGNGQQMQALAVQFPDGSTNLLRTDEISQDSLKQVTRKDTNKYVKSIEPKKPRGRPKKIHLKESLDILDDSNSHLQLLANCPQDLSEAAFLETSGKLSIDTCRVENAPEGVSAKQQQNSNRRPDGKPRKKRKKDSVDNLDGSNLYLHPLAVELPKDLSKSLSVDASYLETAEIVAEENYYKKQNDSGTGVSTEHQQQIPRGTDAENLKSVLRLPKSKLNKCQAGVKNQLKSTDLLLTQTCQTSLLNSETFSNCGKNPVRSSEIMANSVSSETDPHSCPIPEDVAMPRLVLCLAHNGKVAWDVKWRPFDSFANSMYRMGYLAVLLGNGALEVWEIPLPHATEVIFSAREKEGTDPRFVKLEPVFRCSTLMSGDRQSIPLTVEWSTSSPHDLILAGCHDGVVGLWKFSADGPSKDSRPLLCFSADTVPIRALAWSPVASDPESANIVVTAGHKGVKFWDIRDPFRPLWDVNPVERSIYSLDWLPDPRCVVLSFDDGEITVISLVKAAYDAPVTGKPFVGTAAQGLSSYYCSSSSIWSVQVSRLTGMVAYCCSDGTVLRFQLTQKAVEKDPRRSREPHYLCGSLTEEESTLTVLSPLPGIPFPMKKSSKEWSNIPTSRRGFLVSKNQGKRTKEQMTKCQTPEELPLALCYGNDPGNNSESDDAVAPESKQASKTKGSSTNEIPESSQALVCIDEEVPLDYKCEEDDVKENVDKEERKEAFPPKIVAMHRVRWNMNKGSERWLCYGGAAGIVRCQEIDFSMP